MTEEKVVQLANVPTPIALMRDAYTQQVCDDGALREDILKELIGIGVAFPISYWFHVLACLGVCTDTISGGKVNNEIKYEISQMLIELCGREKFHECYARALLHIK